MTRRGDIGAGLMLVGALVLARGHRGSGRVTREGGRHEPRGDGGGDAALIRAEQRAKLVDIAVPVGVTTLLGVLLPVLLATLLSPPTQTRSITTTWWELPFLQLPDLAWTEIVLAAVALPTTLVIAVAVGPQSSEHSSGRRVYVSEVVRAEVVEALATLTAATSSVLLWVLAAFVPRSPGGLAQALLLALAALYCACLAGLGGPSHRQRLRTLDELLRLREASSWVDTVRPPGRVRTFASYLVLVIIPAVAVTLLVLARLQALGALVEWWALAVVLGVATAAVSGLTWLSWLAWTAPRVSRPGCSSLEELRRPSPWRVLHVLIVLLWAMGALPGLVWLSRRQNPALLDLAIALFISVAPLLGLWLLRRRRVSTPALQRAALWERRRLVRQAESARRRVGAVAASSLSG